MMDQFLAFSAEVTAFSQFELLGTGQAKAYLDAIEGVVGRALLEELLAAYGRINDSDPAAREKELRRSIFGDERLGPIARNVIKLWYVGIWYELPRAWTDSFGALEKDSTFMVSADAYPEGLLWTAIGAHAPGAKAPGYASWVDAPLIPAF